MESSPTEACTCDDYKTAEPDRRSDVAWRKELNAAGLAWSFSNNRNERITSHSEYMAFVISSLVAEGLAIR
ncbi:unnamed protein product [Eruca vesicaria subsp. sativa]|uniref:Uncharacterized protein n=1 Tax=Eruca vesicaria subsp. sativa TaxID=29727 RepID=A0ABC8L766_ERUVS|nr:unnamed protein product [Eruca vesicaria subsp. sativa]